MTLQIDRTTSLGEGVFAKVYMGRDTASGVDLAVKIYSEDVGTHESRFFQCRAEYAFLKSLAHPNIVQVVSTVCGPPGEPVCLLMQLAPSGDLHGRLKSSGGAGLPAHSAVPIVRGIAAGLEYLHTEHKLMHGDIKPENVLLDGNTPLLGDFDAALPFGTQMDPPRGTIAYHPPEYERSKPRLRSVLPKPSPSRAAHEKRALPVASGAGDVWAAGMVFVMVFTGLDPEAVAKPKGVGYWRWAGKPKVDPRKAFLGATDSRRNPWPSMGPAMRGVTVSVLSAGDPAKRPTASDLVERLGDGDGLSAEVASFWRRWAAGALAASAQRGDGDDDDDMLTLLGGRDRGSPAEDTISISSVSSALSSMYDAVCARTGNPADACVVM